MNFNIILIRHAETDYGEKNQFMGTLDIPCSERGKLRAMEASRKINPLSYFRIYSSPLIRARQTATILFPNQGLIIEQNLAERGLGEWAGKDLSTIKKLFPEAFYKSGIINPYYTPRDGETIESVIFRVKIFLELLVDLFDALKSDSQQPTSNDIAIVTHNGIIRVLRCLLDSSPVSEIFKENEPHLKLIKYNFNGLIWNRLDEVHF